jgi:Carbohydrate-selective porin, OprB family/S-layer homology domain
MSIKYIILVLSTLVLGISAGLVKAEQTQINVDNAITSEDSQSLGNVPSNTVADLLSSENNELTADITEDPQMGQINDVSQLTDVSSQDWAYDSLRNLVERYRCIAPDPDGTFKGDRSMSRYEFASILNSCLRQMEKLFIADNNNFVRKDDLAAIQKLKDDFTPELSALQQRIDNLDGKTTALEKSQFSNTAFFGGEAIFGLAMAGGGDPPGTGKGHTVLTNLTRVGLVSSFTGKDRLRVMLATGNFDNLGFANPESLNTRMSLMSYQAGLANQVQLDSLEYRFATLGDRVVFTIKPYGFGLNDVLTANSAYYDSGRGAISRFAEASPVFKIGALDSGAGFDWLVNDILRVQVAYGVRNGSNPNLGISKSDHSALGVQFLIKPASNILGGLAYINGYSSDGHLDTFTGSFNADTSSQLFSATPMNIHALNGSFQWRLSPKVTFGTWGGLIYSEGIDSNAYAVSSTYLFSLGFPEPFGRQGDLFAFLVGQPPNLYIGSGPVSVDPGTSMHYEAFYRFRVNDRIAVTPGFFVVTDPGNNPDNKTIVVGTVRTTFRF